MKKTLLFLTLATVLLMGCREREDFHFSTLDLYGTWDGIELYYPDYYYQRWIDLTNNEDYSGSISFYPKGKCDGTVSHRKDTYNVNGTYTVEDKVIFIDAADGWYYENIRNGSAEVIAFDRKKKEAELSVNIKGEIKGIRLRIKKR
jgi:hypothetical protein